MKRQVKEKKLLKNKCMPLQRNLELKSIQNWLEYNVNNDAAFCLCCYLFRPNFGKQLSGDSFATIRFTNWKKKELFTEHVGSSNSAHNQAWQKCVDLMKQSQHIEVVIFKQSEKTRSLYRARLTASVDCIRYLLRQGLAFRGHDESESSLNQGNFLELLKFAANYNKDVKKFMLQNAPENNQLTSSEIQKDIVHVAALETTYAIVNELGDEFYVILVDESRDISDKE